MKIELNLNNVSSDVIKHLLNDNVITFGMISIDQKVDYFNGFHICRVLECDDLTHNEKVIIVTKLFENDWVPKLSGWGEINYHFIKDNCSSILEKYHDLFIKTIHPNVVLEELFDVFEFFEQMKVELTLKQKQEVYKKFWKYVEDCDTYATSTHIYPENTPEWCINYYKGDYDSIHRRIALHKATKWEHYNPAKPDNRVQVRAAYAAEFGTNKEQAIHDNAYSLRLKAVAEHNIKL